MAESDWSARYKQQDERSRWYSSQLWYVPFAYLALVGLGVEKVMALDEPLKGIALFSLAVFSFAIFVHMCHLKFYERRAVRGLQLLEEEAGKPVVAFGASPWYVSFIPYIKFLLALITYAFLMLATEPASLPTTSAVQCAIRTLGLVVATGLFALVIWKDWQRNVELTRQIRNAAKF